MSVLTATTVIEQCREHRPEWGWTPIRAGLMGGSEASVADTWDIYAEAARVSVLYQDPAIRDVYECVGSTIKARLDDALRYIHEEWKETGRGISVLPGVAEQDSAAPHAAGAPPWHSTASNPGRNVKIAVSIDTAEAEAALDSLIVKAERLRGLLDGLPGMGGGK